MAGLSFPCILIAIHPRQIIAGHAEGASHYTSWSDVETLLRVQRIHSQQETRPAPIGGKAGTRILLVFYGLALSEQGEQHAKAGKIELNRSRRSLLYADLAEEWGELMKLAEP
jgi:hypothetical protein